VTLTFSDGNVYDGFVVAHAAVDALRIAVEQICAPTPTGLVVYQADEVTGVDIIEQPAVALP
jgi:hypothetical protein